jgi:hypothetical protein
MYKQGLWPTLTRALTQATRGDGTGLLAPADGCLGMPRDGHYGQDVTSDLPIYAQVRWRTPDDGRVCGQSADKAQRPYPE